MEVVLYARDLCRRASATAPCTLRKAIVRLLRRVVGASRGAERPHAPHALLPRLALAREQRTAAHAETCAVLRLQVDRDRRGGGGGGAWLLLPLLLRPLPLSLPAPLPFACAGHLTLADDDNVRFIFAADGHARCLLVVIVGEVDRQRRWRRRCC